MRYMQRSTLTRQTSGRTYWCIKRLTMYLDLAYKWSKHKITHVVPTEGDNQVAAGAYRETTACLCWQLSSCTCTCLPLFRMLFYIHDLPLMLLDHAISCNLDLPAFLKKLLPTWCCVHAADDQVSYCYKTSI